MKRAEILKDLIDSTGMDLKSFAEEKAEIPYTTLYSILKRGVGKASVDSVIKICKALGITIEQLDEMARKNEYCNHTDYNIITLAAHRTDGYDTDLPEEAKEELKNYIDYLKVKYRKKD
mgnify:CR=1 FL=1